MWKEDKNRAFKSSADMAEWEPPHTTMNISSIITIDPCAIKNGRGSALLKPGNYAATTKGQRPHGLTNKHIHICVSIKWQEMYIVRNNSTEDKILSKIKSLVGDILEDAVYSLYQHMKIDYYQTTLSSI